MKYSNKLYVFTQCIGYYEDEVKHIFGTNKKEVKRPLSNFSFKFVKKVVSVHSASTGFLVEVTPETVGDESETDDEIGVDDLLGTPITRLDRRSSITQFH